MPTLVVYYQTDVVRHMYKPNSLVFTYKKEKKLHVKSHLGVSLPSRKAENVKSETFYYINRFLKEATKQQQKKKRDSLYSSIHCDYD